MVDVKMGTVSNAELKVIIDLTELLNKNAEKVTSGETKVCLTTSSLSILAASFRRYSESSERSSVTEGAGPTKWIDKIKRKKSSIDHGKWRENIRILFDFVIKIKSLKVIHGSNTLKAPVQIARFRALHVLEVKKVPIHMVEGLSKLRGQLTDIVVTRSAQSLQDVLEICGGDRSSGFVWSNLKTVYVSFNGFNQLDNSLRFIPFVEVLDLSHNNIVTTEDYLQHLTDISRLNLGYNMLSKVPQFSYSNKGKLRILVLRNNNLDTLEGIEELKLLEELDVTENCLMEHSVLKVLYSLDRLTVLCLMGNPLYYITDHRLATIKHISPHVRTGEFFLDGRNLSADEVFVHRRNKYNQHSDYPDNPVTIVQDPPSGDDPLIVNPIKNDSSGAQLVPGSSHSDKKKRGHRRVKSRERIAKIADMSDSFAESYDDSPAIESSKEEEHVTAQIELDKKKIEIMRKHYKDDWLKALSADRGKESTEPGRRKEDAESIDNSQDKVDKHMEDNGNSAAGSKQHTASNGNIQTTEDKDTKTIEPIKTDSSQTTPPTQDETQPSIAPVPETPSAVIKIEQTTDIYAFSRMESTEVLQTVERTELFDESLEQYGEESDPFIVMLPEKDMSHLIVTVNNRYIVEKNLNGEKREALDLKCLKELNRSEEQLSGKDIIWGLTFTVVTLKFDYARKDMRERRYAMEDDAFADKLESLLSVHLKKKAEDMVECLKCQHRFPKAESNSSFLPACPKCRSKMLIKVDTVIIETPQETNDSKIETNRSALEPHGSKSSFSPKDSTRLQRRSGYRRSKHKHVDTKSADDNTKTETIETNSTDTIDGNLVTSNPPSEDLKSSNNSWSDLQKLAVSTRSSISSIESDITILASHSNKSGASINQSSHNSLAESDSEHFVSAVEDQSESLFHLTLAKQSSSASIDIQSGSLKENLENFGWIKDKNEQVTPVGSPLSNSVCSSMVSSVYENTLPGGGKQQGDGSIENTQDSSFTSSSADSLSVRRRNSPHRRSNSRSNNRKAMISEAGSTESDSHVTSAIDHSESSINTVPSFSISDTDRDKSVLSIYDAVSETDSLERSHDLSKTTSDKSETAELHSSPLRRKGSARKSAKNRSAIYSEVSDDSNTQSSGSLGLYDFPADVSPIKRTSTGRSGRSNNRSAVVLDDYWPSEESVSRDISQGTRELSDDIDGEHLKETDSKSSDANPLPWEHETADKVLGGVNLDEFRNVDHRIQLYLELKVFQADEVCQCAIQCDIVQYMNAKPVKSLLVISTHRLLIFKINGDQDSNVSSDWLKCYEDQPIAELRYIDIGLGYQSLRIEFNTTCSSFSLLIADESRCKNFLALITDIIHNLDHSKLEGISKSNPVTLKNVGIDILMRETTDEELPDEDGQTLIRYLIVTYTDEDSDTENGTLMGLAVTNTDLVLIEENHQWPLPRLQAALSDQSKQFTVVGREKINNIESLMFNEFNPRELRLSFFETSDVNSKPVWMVSMETTGGVKSFVDAIRDPWEEEFGVSLDVTSASFTDESVSSKQ